MIKINLLPTKKKKKPKPLPMFIVGGVFMLLATLGISFYLMYVLNNKLAALSNQKKNNEQKLADLEQKLKEVNRFEELNKTFQQRKKIIEELTLSQALPVKILDEISKTLSEGIWITAMNITQGKIQLSGYGFTNSDIVNYVQGLKGSQLFVGVVLHGTSRSMMGDIETYSFTISFEVKA